MKGEREIEGERIENKRKDREGQGARWMERHTQRVKGGQRESEMRERDREMETERQTETEIDRETEKGRERDRWRYTHRVRDRRETERYRDDNCISLEPQSKGGMSLVHVSK